ncbi:MAG: CPXCG motif-containing cysteine-rich protein [Fidelibacterota bacterium]
MEIKITCHFCFQIFNIEIGILNGSNNEIWDCEVCCNPNKILYRFEKEKITQLEISDGNE